MSTTNANKNSNTEEPADKKTKTEWAVPSVLNKEVEKVVAAIRKCLDNHDTNRKEVQEQLHGTCEKWKKEIDDLEDKINSELEEKFKEKDSCLQAALSNLQTTTTTTAEEAKNHRSTPEG